MKDEEERRQAKALEQALFELRKQAQASGDANAASDLDLRRQQLEHARVNAERAAAIEREQMGVTRENAAATRELTAAQRAETERHNRKMEEVSGQRADATSARAGRGWAPVVTQGPNGEIMIVDKNTHTVAPTSAAGAVPTGAGGSPVGSQARPAQGERDAAAAYSNLDSALKQLETQMGGVGYAAPTIPEQVAIDAAKGTGTGVISSFKRSVANTYLGKNAPERQAIEQSVKTLGTLIVKMVTGAQMSEPEAQRIMGILSTVAGDRPELAKQKIESVKDIIRGQRVKLGRAAGMTTGTEPVAPSATPGISPMKQKYGLE
jgi:hypothetical protein